MGKKATMQDVANRAGVSKTTVSIVFNNPSRLSNATVQAVLSAATELDYARDPMAQMFRTRQTNSLGLLLPQALDKVLENPYYTQFLQGIGQVCQREGYTLLLAPPLRGSMLKTIPYTAVDGFIVSGLEDDRGEVNALRQRGMPFVLVDSENQAGTPSIEIDDTDGMYELVRMLLSLGHRRIALVAIDTGTPGGYQAWRGSVRRRMDGCVNALATAGLTPEDESITIIETPCTRQGGSEAFNALWKETNRPTAIVAFSDIIAFGVLEAARAAGVDVPGQLSVTGFDDLAEASQVTPTLTTIRQPILAKGRLAAEYLVESINADEPLPLHHQRLNTTLLMRQSVAAPVQD